MKNYINTILFIIFSCTSFFANASSPYQNTIFYHLTMPPVLNDNIETIPTQGVYLNLIEYNYVAGVLLSFLIHEQYPDLKFDSDYTNALIFSQLLQQNINLHTYPQMINTPYINTSEQRQVINSPAIGGAYGLLFPSMLSEYTVLQKSLHDNVATEKNAQQKQNELPNVLDSKAFGPLAAAYYIFNTLFLFDHYQPSGWEACKASLKNGAFPYFSTILNSSFIGIPTLKPTTTFLAICANPKTHVTAMNAIPNYHLNSTEYMNQVGLVGTSEVYVLYPRQNRYYSDELYNRIPGVSNHTNILMQDLQTVFINEMHSLAYMNNDKQYDFIAQSLAQSAFEYALQQSGLDETSQLDLSNANERAKLNQVTTQALANVQSHFALGFTFANTANKEL